MHVCVFIYTYKINTVPTYILCKRKPLIWMWLIAINRLSSLISIYFDLDYESCKMQTFQPLFSKVMLEVHLTFLHLSLCIRFCKILLGHPKALHGIPCRANRIFQHVDFLSAESPWTVFVFETRFSVWPERSSLPNPSAWHGASPRSRWSSAHWNE